MISLAHLPPVLTPRQLAAALVIPYSTFRKHEAAGYFADLEERPVRGPRRRYLTALVERHLNGEGVTHHVVSHRRVRGGDSRRGLRAVRGAGAGAVAEAQAGEPADRSVA